MFESMFDCFTLGVSGMRENQLTEYFAEISQWTKVSNRFSFSFSLLFSEIARVRASLFQINGVRKEPLQLPEPDGETVTLNEKVYVPVKEHPDVSTVFEIFIF